MQPNERKLPPTKVLVAYGLLVAGVLLWEDGPLTAWYSGLLFLAAAAVLVIHHLMPALLATWPVVGDPNTRLEAVAIALFAAGVLRGGFFIGFFMYFAGWYLFVRETRSPEVPDTVAPARIWHSGWVVRVLALGVFLALLILADEFAGEFNSSYSYESGGYRYTSTSSFDASSGYDTGQSPWLALFLLPAALWLVWDRARSVANARLIPLVSVGLAAAYGIWVMFDDYRFVQELYEIGGTYARFQASGPAWFVIACIPAAVAAVLIAFKGAGKQMLEEGAGD